ncbi:hypothetical protein QMT15_21520, partial [Cronobacter sakazakii]|nr:hypothetical protein [Cronobacter sakazakii]
ARRSPKASTGKPSDLSRAAQSVRRHTLSLTFAAPVSGFFLAHRFRIMLYHFSRLPPGLFPHSLSMLKGLYF